MYSAFGDLNEPQSAAFGPQKHRKLFFNKETLRWEPVAPEAEDAYDKAYASNSAMGAFKTFGKVGSTGVDTSTEEERTALNPVGSAPEFYGGTGSGLGGAQHGGSLEALRALIAQQQEQQAQYAEQDRRAAEKKQRGY